MLIEDSLDVRDFLDYCTLKSPINYSEALKEMKKFTSSRNEKTKDEFWILEHNPIFTLGKAADQSHILDNKNIKVIRSDRGGQVTYHGPGQLMIYNFIDLTRKNISVRFLVESLEKGIINTLSNYNIKAHGDRKAPGVYVDGKKIAALGLRISRGRSYHGICFNFNFDEKPFSYINPCGFSGLEVTQLKNLVKALPDKNSFTKELIKNTAKGLGYMKINYFSENWIKK